MAPSKNQEREAREARDRLKRYTARQAVHGAQVTRRKRDNWIAAGGVVVIAALAATTQFFFFNGGPGTPTAAPSASASADTAAGANQGDVPGTEVSEFRTWTGSITINDVALSIELDGAAAPQGVAAFVNDANNGYYVGKTCHRLVEDDSTGLLQCGSTNGDGIDDPTLFSYGPIENAPTDGNYVTGTLAVARTASAYGNGHQFFIVFGDSYLPGDEFGGYTVIGKVTAGIDQLKSSIVAGGITPGSDGSTTDGAPVIPATILGVTVQ